MLAMWRETCECKTLSQMEYKREHYNIAKVVYWRLCGKYHLEKRGSMVRQRAR